MTPAPPHRARLADASASLWRARGGSSTIEKVFVIALLVFVVAIGVRALGSKTKGTLECQGRTIAQADGTMVCASGAAAVVASNTAAAPPAAADTPPRKCTGTYCMCFVAGTPVLTESGPQPIETIPPGALVLSRAEDGGEARWRPVLQTFVSTSRSLLRLSVAHPGGATEILETTGNHPFYARGRGWVEARALVPGHDELTDVAGTPLAIVAVEPRPVAVPVYNLEVEQDHTYFVGQLGIWVHNRTGRISKVRRTLYNGNPIGKAIPIKVPIGDGTDVYASAVVTRRNGDGTFEVQWRQNGTLVTGTSDENGVVAARPLIGQRIQVQNAAGKLIDVVVIRRNNDLSVEVEGNDAGQRFSGTVATTGGLTVHPPTAPKVPYAGGGTIAGIPVTIKKNPFVPSIATYEVGKIKILTPLKPTTGWKEPYTAAAAATFQQDTLDDLNTIASTAAGQALLNELQKNPQGVEIKFISGYGFPHYGGDLDVPFAINSAGNGEWDSANDSPGNTSGLVTLSYNPSVSSLPLLPRGGPNANANDAAMLETVQQDWGRAQNFPSDVILFHELIHVDDYRKGINRTQTFDSTIVLGEERTVGLGDFATTTFTGYTENVYRTQRRLPLRTFYSNADERFSTTDGRGMTAQNYGVPNVGPLTMMIGGTAQPIVARLSLVTEISSANRTEAALAGLGGAGHTWIAIEFMNPDRDLPPTWAQKYPDHFQGLQNPSRTPLGHHLGFSAVPGTPARDIVTKTVPGVVVIHTGRNNLTKRIAAYKSYPLTVGQVDQVLTYVDNSRGTTNYNFFKTNCTSWAVCAVQAANQTPPSKLKVFGTENPNGLYDAIKREQKSGSADAHAWKLVKAELNTSAGTVTKRVPNSGNALTPPAAWAVPPQPPVPNIQGVQVGNEWALNPINAPQPPPNPPPVQPNQAGTQPTVTPLIRLPTAPPGWRSTDQTSGGCG